MDGDQSKDQVQADAPAEGEKAAIPPDKPKSVTIELNENKSAGDPDEQTNVSPTEEPAENQTIKQPSPAEEPAENKPVLPEEDPEPETGLRIQVPESILPALVDVDGLGAVSRPSPPPRPRILLWNHLTCCDVRQIRRATSIAELKDIVGVRVPETLDCTANMASSILLELLLYVLQYAREDDLNEEQTSVVFSVAKETHDYATSTCFGNVADTFSYFRDLMAAHCVIRPPWSLDLFEPEQAERFARFFADMYIRHFSLVKAAFTPYVTLDVDIWYDPKICLPPEEEKQDEEASRDGEGDKGADAVARPGTPEPPGMRK